MAAAAGTMLALLASMAGTSAQTIIPPERPDLVVSAITAPAIAAVGQSISFVNTVSNQGSAAAGPFRIAFYLSPDAVITPGVDPLLGSRMLPALGVGGSSTETTVLTVPAGLPRGRYYAAAVADADVIVIESHEANNTGLTADTVKISFFRPDLVVPRVTAPSTAAVGRPIVVGNTIKNEGPEGATAGSFRVDFLLSPDPTITPGTDRLLGSRTVSGLAAGAKSAVNTTRTIPANLPPGQYYLAVVADAGGDVREIGEGNNTRRTSDPITITAFRADLVVSALTAPASAQTGQPIAFTNTVRNEGPASATAFRIDFYLSPDTTITPATDRLLGSRTVGGLAAGARSTATTTLTVPADLPARTYYLGAKVDAGTSVRELSESNNLRRAASATTISADRPALTIAKAGAGAGSVTSSPAGISCGGDCVQRYPAGTLVTLTAAAASGSIFAGWSGGGCAGSAPCTVTVNRNKTVTATFVPAGGLVVSSLSAASLPPARRLTIAGPAFDTSARLSAVFSRGGRSVEVPAIQASSTSLVVPVPPFLDPVTGLIVAGNVNVQVVQDDGVTVRYSNALGFRILAAPTTPLPPGRVTLAFLRATHSQALALKAELTDFLVITALDQQIDHLALLIARVQGVLDNPSAPFDLGTVDGTPLVIGTAELRAMDRMTLAMLQALAQPPAPTSGGIAGSAATGCMQTEAADALLAAQAGNDPDLLLRRLTQAPRSSLACRAPDAINTGMAVVAAGGVIGIGIVAVVAGAVGAPVALSIALPTAALLYLTIALGGGEIGVGGALGQTTAGAGELVQQGMQRLDGVYQDLASTVLPDAGGPWVDIANGIRDMSDAFTNSPLPPPAPPPPIPAVTGIAFTGTGSTTSVVITPAIGGVSVSYSVVGTDGFTASGTVVTNSVGGASFGIPPGASGVVDTIVVTVVGGPSASTTHGW